MTDLDNDFYEGLLAGRDACRAREVRPLQKKLDEIRAYCKKDLEDNIMYASIITGIILDCEFREAKWKTKELNE